MKYVFISICAIGLLSSCNSNSSSIEKKEGEVSSNVAAGGETEAELKASLAEIDKEEKDRLKNEVENMTSMSFDKLTHEFGKVKADTENKASYIVTNTGNKPLIIDKVDVSCGCTTAKKPEKPILPGKSDKIEIVFHPKPGQLNEQEKTITVTANTDPKIVVLKLKAFVEPK